MKIITSEFAHSYQNFSFGYAEFLLREPKDNLSEIYNKGFLPDSSNPKITNAFYRARSARVNLEKWEISSENKRILKRFSNITSEPVPLHDFNTKDIEFRAFCLTYFEKRHGPSAMPESKFDTILQTKLVQDVLIYRKNEKIAGYVFEVSDKSMGHFWFSFYDLVFAFQSLGMWLMIDGVQQAKRMGKKHYYLGTVYGEKALYKTNFNCLEFWDGNIWNNDIKELKKRSRDDHNRVCDKVALWKEDKFTAKS